MLDIDVHNGQNCSTWMEPALLDLTEKLKQSALVIQPRIHTKNRNNRKYMDRWYNSVVTRQKIIYEM